LQGNSNFQGLAPKPSPWRRRKKSSTWKNPEIRNVGHREKLRTKERRQPSPKKRRKMGESRQTPTGDRHHESQKRESIELRKES